MVLLHFDKRLFGVPFKCTMNVWTENSEYVEISIDEFLPYHEKVKDFPLSIIDKGVYPLSKGMKEYNFTQLGDMVYLRISNYMRPDLFNNVLKNIHDLQMKSIDSGSDVIDPVFEALTDKKSRQVILLPFVSIYKYNSTPIPIAFSITIKNGLIIPHYIF